MPRGDVIYEATVAKHLLAGEGFSTNLMPLGGVRTLLRLGIASADVWPSLHKFVLSQVRIAAFGAVLGVNERALVISSFVPYAALMLLTFAVMLRIDVGRRIAFAFSLALVLFNELLFVGVSGLGLSTDALLFLGTLALGLCVVKRRHLAPWLGVLLAATTPHRYSMAPWVPFVHAASPRSGVKTLLSCGLLLGPFIAWSFVRFGMPSPSYR